MYFIVVYSREKGPWELRDSTFKDHLFVVTMVFLLLSYKTNRSKRVN